MKQEVYNYYTSCLSSKKLVFRHMKIWWTSYLIISIIAPILSFYYGISNNIKMVFLIMMSFAFFTGIINEQAKKVLLKKYNIKPNQKKWANDEYVKMRLELLGKYMEQRGLYTEKKLKELIEICYKEAERKKFKGYINWGLFLAISIPLWTQFLASIFRLSNSINDSLNILGSIFIITLFIFVIISSVKFVSQDIINSFFNKKSSEYKQLAYELEDILFLVDTKTT